MRQRFEPLQQLQGDPAPLVTGLDEGSVDFSGLQVDHGIAHQLTIFLGNDGAAGQHQQR